MFWRFPVSSHSFKCLINASRRWTVVESHSRLRHNEAVLPITSEFHSEISVDDFGILSSFARTSSAESVGSVRDFSFLDNLLKSNSSSSVVNDFQVPTTADPEDLGGTLDVVENNGSDGNFGKIEHLLCGDYDMAAVSEELYDSPAPSSEGSDSWTPSTSKSATGSNSMILPESKFFTTSTARREHDENYDECEGSAPFLISQNRSVIPNVSYLTIMRSLGEHKQSKPDVYHPVSSINTEANESEGMTIASSGFANDTQLEINSVSSVEGPAVISRFDPNPAREEMADMDELRYLRNNNDIVGLRSLLSQKRWPQTILHRHHDQFRGSVLQWIVDSAVDADEAIMFLRDFATTSLRAYIEDDIMVRLLTRLVKEKGITETEKSMGHARTMFMVKSPYQKPRNQNISVLKDFYKEVISKGCIGDAEKLSEQAILLGFDVDAQVMMQTVLQHLRDDNSSYDVMRKTLERLSNRFGLWSGGEVLWQNVWSQGSHKEVAKKVAQLLTLGKRTEHPMTVAAEMVCSLVVSGHPQMAEKLFEKVAISGRHFVKPLKRISLEKDGLKNVECMGALISSCMYGEKRRGRRTKSIDQEPMELSFELLSVLDVFFGLGKTKKRSKSIPMRKMDKRKIHRVDVEELRDLTAVLHNIWIDLAESSNDIESVCLLEKWCIENKVELNRKIIARVEKMKSSRNTVKS